MLHSSKTAKILIVNNDDNLIPILEKEIKSFGFNITVNNVRSFSELDKPNLKELYDAFILTDFGLQPSDLISCVSELELCNLSFLILISRNNPQLILKLSEFVFDQRGLSYPANYNQLRFSLELLIKHEKYTPSLTDPLPKWFEESGEYIKEGNTGNFHNDLLKYLEKRRASASKRFGYIILLISILICSIIFIGKLFFLIYLILGILLFTITKILKLSKSKYWIVDLILSIVMWPAMLAFWDEFFKKINIRKKQTYQDKFNSIPGIKQIGDYFEVMNKEGTIDDMIPNGVGHFGFEVTNPVPTNNIFGSHVYLGRLRDKNGDPIKYERLGSTSSDNVSNPIDIYKITDSNNEELGTIYISPYQKTISRRAPEGFSIK